MNPDHRLLSWLDFGPPPPPGGAEERPPRVPEQQVRVYHCTPHAAPAPAAARVTAAPSPFPSEHEQAAHELDLAIALVLNSPEAGRSLRLLADEDRIHPEGALVFACLLALTDRGEAAQFWWQFAAGSGSPTAAYLLHLHHLRLGEPRDAAYWRSQSEALAGAPRRRPVRPGPTAPLLPDEVRHEILARCHEGLGARLPLAAEAALNRLTVVAVDEDFGEIPQPSTALTDQLAAAD
ncbi:hypothetical protein [Kitasatospora viridis]|uniref:Uncharacterized protein n=1 Tax=Kitasatospora viridis TaxID=281105 RepID=A0A561TT52_9ACTN|nr:hypothetical protein [Kitasatospora viridis]TWF90299.1 hypothetical protein FHX73_13343 [Kitasatospora viridis]